MNSLAKLNLRYLRQNRARTIATIIGIALSVALITAIIGIATSGLYSMRKNAVDTYGDYHVMYRDVPGDKVAILENAKYMTVQYYSDHVECAEYESCYGNTLTTADYTPFTDESRIKRDADHYYNVFLYYAPTTKFRLANDLAEKELAKAGYYARGDFNSIVAETDGALKETPRIMIASIAIFVIGAIAIVSAFVIRNSFNISITERARQFGMLSSIGARPKQIRNIVCQEAFFVGFIAIPFGIALGSAATAVIMQIINHLVGDILEIQMLFYIPPLAFLAIIFTSLVIILLSGISPAIVAGRISPIEALRSNKDVEIKARKVRTSRLARKLFGIGGVMAAKNLKRSRGKYATTVIAIVLSVSVFVGVSSFVGYSQKVMDLVLGDYTGANFSYYADNDKRYKDIIAHFQPKEYMYYYMLSTYYDGYSDEDDTPWVVALSADEFARYAKRSGVLSGDYDNIAIYKNTYIGFERGVTVYRTLDNYKAGDQAELQFSRLVESDELTVTTCSGVYDTGEYYEEPCEFHDIEEQLSDVYMIEIAATADENPFGLSKSYSYRNGIIYISENHPMFAETKEFAYLGTLEIGDSGLGAQITSYIESDEFATKFADDNSTSYAVDSEGAMNLLRGLLTLSEVMIYSFIIVVALIGITNIFNTISTNVALRAKEFAILKSIGMTKREFNRMIRLESLMYTTRALLIGLPLGLIISFLVSRLFIAIDLGYGWVIPWPAIIISIVSVGLLIAAIMRYSIRKINKQNIIETIREESF